MALDAMLFFTFAGISLALPLPENDPPIARLNLSQLSPER